MLITQLCSCPIQATLTMQVSYIPPPGSAPIFQPPHPPEPLPYSNPAMEMDTVTSKNLLLILLASATYNICDCVPSMSLSEQWFLWTHWGRRTRRAWSCWSRQRIRGATMATPWSLLEIRAPQATSPQQPRYPNAHLRPTTLTVDWRRGEEEPAVSPRSCPTNHRTYRCPSVTVVVEIKSNLWLDFDFLIMLNVFHFHFIDLFFKHVTHI